MFSLQLMFKHCTQGTLLHFYFPIAKEVQEVYYFYISLLESILPVTEYSMVQGCSLASSQVHHGQSTWHASIYLNIYGNTRRPFSACMSFPFRLVLFLRYEVTSLEKGITFCSLACGIKS